MLIDLKTRSRGFSTRGINPGSFQLPKIKIYFPKTIEIVFSLMVNLKADTFTEYSRIFC